MIPLAGILLRFWYICYNEKRSAAPTTANPIHNLAPAWIRAQHPSKGILTMDNLLLNSLAVHHSRAFHDLKKERPDQVDLLVSKHNSGETLTAQKQATGIKQKNSEQNAHYPDQANKKGIKQATGVQKSKK